MKAVESAWRVSMLGFDSEEPFESARDAIAHARKMLKHHKKSNVTVQVTKSLWLKSSEAHHLDCEATHCSPLCDFQEGRREE